MPKSAPRSEEAGLRAKARKLLKLGRAKVLRRYPFTIIIKDLEVENCVTHDHQLKIDPGAQTTGFAILQGNRVIWGNVGHVGTLYIEDYQPLLITAKGHETRQICLSYKFGFPRLHCSPKKIHKGFQTGDIVRVVVTKGKKIGTYIGRIATRKTGSFDITIPKGKVSGISYKYCQAIHLKDGYSYQFHGG